MSYDLMMGGSLFILVGIVGRRRRAWIAKSEAVRRICSDVLAAMLETAFLVWFGSWKAATDCSVIGSF